MAQGVRIQVKGLTELRKKLGNLPANVVKEVNADISAIADEYVHRAVNDAPRDEGFTASRISKKAKTPTKGIAQQEIVCDAPYAAYIEFGTKSRVKIPAGLEGVAAQFKGKGTGDYYDFLNSILDWVRRKGITARYSVKTRRRQKENKDDTERLLEAAQAIAHSIIRHGVNAHPFFFKQLPWAQEQVSKLDQSIAKAINK